MGMWGHQPSLVQVVTGCSGPACFMAAAKSNTSCCVAGSLLQVASCHGSALVAFQRPPTPVSQCGGRGRWNVAGWGGEKHDGDQAKESWIEAKKREEAAAAMQPISYPPSQHRSIFLGPLGLASTKLLAQVQFIMAQNRFILVAEVYSLVKGTHVPLPGGDFRNCSHHYHQHHPHPHMLRWVLWWSDCIAMREV